MAFLKRLTFLSLIITASFTASYAKTDTLRKGLSATTQIELIERLGNKDTGTYADSIVFSGYNKSLNDSYETFYVTNNTPFDISRLIIRFSYTNIKGEVLHEEEYDIQCLIPAGTTRQLSVRTWDKQHNHYYYKSRKPRRSAVPYHVKYKLLRYDVAITVE